MKKCSACGDWKDLNEFHKDKSKPDGHRYQCKSCGKEYREENKEQIRERSKKWSEANPDRKAEYGKEYREANREQESARYKKWHKENPEYTKDYYAANKKRIDERNKEYRQAQRQEVPRADDTSDRESQSLTQK